MDRVMWQAGQQRIANSAMKRFMQGLGKSDYPTLYRWSVEQPEQFWVAVWEFCGIRASRHWDTVLESPGDMHEAHWFSGARLNFAENLLHRDSQQAAIIAINERGMRTELSHAELWQQVAGLSAALRADGIQPGDRIAAVLPNASEAVVAMLASAALGAVWTSCSPDFGLDGLLDRFGQVEPKLLLVTDSYQYQGQRYDILDSVTALVQKLPSLLRTLVVPCADTEVETCTLPGACLLADYVAAAEPRDLEFTQLPFDHPLYILYSSGTTGLPKCIVHGAGGTLIQHLKELLLHTDLCATDRVFFYTTCGWMMWNWLVSSLATGACICLYEGAPAYPHPTVLMDMLDSEGISIFGAGAKYYSMLEKADIRPRETHRLSSLKTLLSTGSPLAPESFDYIYTQIKTDVQLASISGGTDIVSCFVLGNPLLPVIRGQIQCCGLGMHVQVFNPQGQPVVEEKGELVCRSPFPSMPVCFWNDPEHRRYRQAYFEKFPGVWAHGDYALQTREGGLIIYGRSDAVLNPGGVRIGTAEIYRQVESMPQVMEAIAVAQAWEDDVRIILFVRLLEGEQLDESLIDAIKQRIRQNTSARHVPARVIQVNDIPRTRSGKIVEKAVKKTIHGEPVDNIQALANPQALECFRNLEELQTP